MGVIEVLWLLLCLSPASGSPPERCAGRGSVRGHADRQSSCVLEGRVFSHAPPALLARWPQFVPLRSVHRMRGQVHRLARRKRSVSVQSRSGSGPPCCQPRLTVRLPLTAVSSGTGDRVELAQAPPSHVQPVLVIECEGDRCPHTNSSCKQMYAPQMLLRVTGQQLQLDLVDVESGCRCDPDNVTRQETPTTTGGPGTGGGDDGLPGPGARTHATAAVITASVGTGAASVTAEMEAKADMTTATLVEVATTEVGSTTGAVTTGAPATTEATTVTTEAVTTAQTATTITATAVTATKSTTVETDAGTVTTEAATVATAAANMTAEAAITTKAETTTESATPDASVRTDLPTGSRTPPSDSQIAESDTATSDNLTTGPAGASTATESTTTAGTTTASTNRPDTTAPITTTRAVTTAGTMKVETSTVGSSSTAAVTKAATTTDGPAAEDTTTESATTESATTESATTESATTEIATTEGTSTEGTTAITTLTDGTTTSKDTGTEGAATKGTTAETSTEGVTAEGPTTTGTTTESASTEGSSTESTTTTNITPALTTTTASTTAKTATSTPTSLPPSTSPSTIPASPRVQPTPVRPRAVTITETSTVCPDAESPPPPPAAATTAEPGPKAPETESPSPPAAATTAEPGPKVAVAILAAYGGEKGDTQERAEDGRTSVAPGVEERVEVSDEEKTGGVDSEAEKPAVGGVELGGATDVGDVTPPLTAEAEIVAGVVGGDGPHSAPLRGDMAPRSARANPRPLPARAPLVSSRHHQTPHNLTQALLHLDGALPLWNQQPQEFGGTHEQLARLLAAFYSLGQKMCVKNPPGTPVLPAWMPVHAPVPATVAEEEGNAIHMISDRSAIQSPHLALRHPFDSAEDHRGSLVEARMSALVGDSPSPDLDASVSADRLAAMQEVEDIMTRQREAINDIYSEQREQLDESLKAQREAIQHTFNVELQYVKDILMAVQPQQEDEIQPPEVEGDEEDYTVVDLEEYDPQDDYDDAGDSEADYKDTEAEKADAPEPQETVSVTNTTRATTESILSAVSTPFARSPDASDQSSCPPFDEDSARETLVRDTRALMDTLFRIALEMYEKVRPADDPASRSAFPKTSLSLARSRVNRQMSWLVRTMAGSEVRFGFALSILEERWATLTRLRELLEAGAASPGSPAGAEYKLTVAVTALTSCFVNNVPGFRVETGPDGRATFLELSESAGPQRRDGGDSSVALRLSAIIERVWDLFCFLLNTFVRPASTVQLLTDQNLRVLALSESELRAGMQRAVSGMSEAQRTELRQLLSSLAADHGELRHAGSELRALMALSADLGSLMLTERPGGDRRSVEAGPSVLIRHVGDALLGGLGCFFSSLAGKWAPSTSEEPTPAPVQTPTEAPTPPVLDVQPTCAPLTTETTDSVLDNVPVFAEMMYKAGLEFLKHFRVAPRSSQAPTTQPLDTSTTPAGLRMERLARVVADSAARFHRSIAVAEGFVSRMEELIELLQAGAGRPRGGEVREDHNLTSALSLKAACFVAHVPGFRLEVSEGASRRAPSEVDVEDDEAYVESKSAPPENPPVALRISVLMVRTWKNCIALFRSFVWPSTDVQLDSSTNVRVLSLREPALRSAILNALSSLDAAERTEIRLLSAALTEENEPLQYALYELRHMLDYMSEITKLLLTTGAAGRQAVAAGPTGIIRHMAYALLHGLGCFSAALAGAGTEDAWGTPPPPTAPPPPPPSAPPALPEPPRCQLLEEANSDDVILGDLEGLMQSLFHMGLRFFHLFRSEPVLPSSSSEPEQRSSSQSPSDSLMTLLLISIRRGARLHDSHLSVLEQSGGRLDQLWALLEAGAGGSQLGTAESDHNLTAAVSAMTGCFVSQLSGYHLERSLQGTKTGGAPVFPPREPDESRTSDSGSVTRRVTGIMAATWRFLRSALAVFVEPNSHVLLHTEKNIRVLRLNVPALRASLLRTISGLDLVQRAELGRVCRELVSLELRFAVAGWRDLAESLSELMELRLTTAARTRRQAAAGPAAIVVQMGRALPHGMQCFLRGLAGAGTGEGETIPSLPPQVTEIPATLPPGGILIPGIPLSEIPPSSEPPTTTVADVTTTTAPPQLLTTPPPPPEDPTGSQEFLTELEVDVLDDILGGRGWLVGDGVGG